MTAFPAILLAAAIALAIGMKLNDWIPTLLAAIIGIVIFGGIFVVANRILKDLKGD